MGEGGGVLISDKETSGLGSVYLSIQYTNMPDSIIKQLLLKQFQASETGCRSVNKISRYNMTIAG